MEPATVADCEGNCQILKCLLDGFEMTTPTSKPGDAEIRKLADARIRELLKTNGPDVSEAAVLASFATWVLPDRHLEIIRERLERWKKVAATRQDRGAKKR